MEDEKTPKGRMTVEKAAIHPKLGLPARLMGRTPEAGMVYLAAVRTFVPGHVPERLTLRSRISDEILTASIRPDDMATVLDDPLVKTVQVSRVVTEDEAPPT